MLIMTSFARLALTTLATREPAILMTSLDDCDVVRYELATPSVTDVRTDTLPRLIYKALSRKSFCIYVKINRLLAERL